MPKLAVMALDAATGRLRWHRQLVHHDIWDYDVMAPPALVTIRRDGREIPAVVVLAKSGLMFLFDRRTGDPLSRVLRGEGRVRDRTQS